LVAVLLLAVLLWKETMMEWGGAAGISFNNKAQVRVVGESAFSACGVRLLPLGRHGGGTRRWPGVVGGEAEDRQGSCGATISWRSISVALVWPPTQKVVGRLLLLLARWRQAFNLHRRPVQGFTATRGFLLKPSGFVPGFGMEGRRSTPQFVSGCIGPDCVFIFLFRVLSAYVEAHFVIDLFAVDVSVICTAPLLLMKST
jgi:hypothetical protein